MWMLRYRPRPAHTVHIHFRIYVSSGIAGLKKLSPSQVDGSLAVAIVSYLQSISLQLDCDCITVFLLFFFSVFYDYCTHKNYKKKRRSSWHSFGSFSSWLLWATWPFYWLSACPVLVNHAWITSSNTWPLPVSCANKKKNFLLVPKFKKMNELDRFKCGSNQCPNRHCVEDNSCLARGQHCVQSHTFLTGTSHSFNNCTFKRTNN